MLNKLSSRLSIIGELFSYLWEQRMWWLIPMVAVLLVFGILLVFAQGSAVAPFIYTIF